MGRTVHRLIVVALVVLAAAVAMANNGPNNGQSTLMAQSTTTSTPTTTSTGVGTDAGTLEPATIERIVAFARTVEPGTATVSAFTVPAGRRLVITDVVITNPATSPACGAAVAPGGANGATSSTTTPRTTTTTTANGTTVIGNGTANGTTVVGNGTVSGATETTAALESGTGALCVPAQTSLTLALTTGLEFTGGQRVLVANRDTAATDGATAAAGPLHYHLRGFLVLTGA